MRVMFVSQCSKNALIETRRIIDQFAERKGDCVWETQITKQGLDTVKKLLKSTARRNTAVACHYFRGNLQSELLWIVGDARKFNLEGSVPTNATGRNILRAGDENDWNTGEAIAILAGIAGLFHDFGKANSLFQLKLKQQKSKKYEPFRHEWISLLLFKAFVGESSDKDWLERLSQISPEFEDQLLKNLPKDHVDCKKNPLRNLPLLAKFIGWLILSHHRMPMCLKSDNEPRIDEIDSWMDGKYFSALWNSYHCDDDWNPKDLKQVISFPEGTPVKSESWCHLAKNISNRAIKYYPLLNRNWFEDVFSMHLTRAALMLSDHLYSADKPHENYQDADYKVYANTEKESGSLKQRLDEHNIGVAQNAFHIARSIPKFQDTLPSITRHKGFKARNKNVKFMWQDKAYDLAYGLKNLSMDKGFFGINLASTGCGKTLANARIMYGLCDEKKGCRFSIALGLRVLTLQTGEALKTRMSLNSDDVAIMIGSKAFQQLYDFQNQNDFNSQVFNGSESLNDLIDEQDYVSYEGSLDDGRLSRWLKSDSKFHKMISAPILVSTIDHLMPATEGLRGGKQIAPLLRLLTSDLVLDEPDDFDVADLHALCRLVHFAGVFGSKVLLSSATLPPSVVNALFEAYAAGRNIFNKACRRPGAGSDICCAWFDEFGVSSSNHFSSESYMFAHGEFVNARISQLEKQTVLRRGALVKIECNDNAKTRVAQAIRNKIYHLHDRHHQVHPSSGKKISIGLIRMANISPMVNVAKSLLSEQANSGYCINYCVYHSQFPMLIRSMIEESLDGILSRHNSDLIWEKPEIISSLEKHPELNHIFIVFATSVAEVGRDHDYDWSIVEPSSMRSIIQLAGRVQRHRFIPPTEPNIMILENNLKGLAGEKLSYNRPGFESDDFHLDIKHLSDALLPFQFERINAIPRLRTSSEMNFRNNLVDLEHMRLQAELFGSKNTVIHSSLWWKSQVHWCGELQRQTPFRRDNGKSRNFIMYVEEEGEEPLFYEWPEGGDLTPVERRFDRVDFKPAKGIYPWFDCDLVNEIKILGMKMELKLREVSLAFTRVKLRDLSEGKRWAYNPILGFHENE